VPGNFIPPLSFEFYWQHRHRHHFLRLLLRKTWKWDLAAISILYFEIFLTILRIFLRLQAATLLSGLIDVLYTIESAHMDADRRGSTKVKYFILTETDVSHQRASISKERSTVEQQCFD